MFLRTILSYPHTAALDIIQPHLPEPLLVQYGLSREQTASAKSIQDVIPGLAGFLNDYIFASPLEQTASELSTTGTNVYTYYFDRPSPFASPMHGVAHHALDLIYVFGNLMQGMEDERDVEMSKQIMQKWIMFANGKEPWDGFSTGKGLHITPDAELVVKPLKEISSRRWAAYPEMARYPDLVKQYGGLLNNAKPFLPVP
jgi:carboxylesterase type B